MRIARKQKMSGVRPANAPALLVVAIAVTGLVGCGVKSAPDFPPGSTYPRHYPKKDKTKAQQSSRLDLTRSPGGENM